MLIKEELNKKLKDNKDFNDRYNIWNEFLKNIKIKENQKFYYRCIKNYLLELPFKFENWIFYKKLIDEQMPKKSKDFDDYYLFFNKFNINYWNSTNFESIENIKLYIINNYFRINKEDLFYNKLNLLKNDADYHGNIVKLLNSSFSDDSTNDIYLERKKYESLSINNLVKLNEYYDYLTGKISNNIIEKIFEIFIKNYFKNEKFWDFYLNKVISDLNFKANIYKFYRKILIIINKKYIVEELILVESLDFKSDFIVIENEIKSYISDNYFLFDNYFNRLLRKNDNKELKIQIDNLLKYNFFPEEKSQIIFKYIGYLKSKNEKNNDLIINFLHLFIKNEPFNISLYSIYFDFIIKNYEYKEYILLIKSQKNEFLNKANKSNFKEENLSNLKKLVSRISRRLVNKIDYILEIEEWFLIFF